MVLKQTKFWNRLNFIYIMLHKFLLNVKRKVSKIMFKQLSEIIEEQSFSCDTIEYVGRCNSGMIHRENSL
jgi:hypothetical protein